MSKVTWKPGTFLYPIPAVMVSCGTMEKSNIITVAWTGIINTNPAMVYISVRPTRYSYNLIKEQGEFVINLTTKDLGSHTMFIAEVLAINSDEKYIDEKGAFDISKCNLISYANGGYYSMGKKLGKFGFSVQKKKIIKSNAKKSKK